jgi:hypothetical protein
MSYTKTDYIDLLLKAELIMKLKLPGSGIWKITVNL